MVTIKQELRGSSAIDDHRYVLTLHKVESDLSLTTLVIVTSKISLASLSTSDTNSLTLDLLKVFSL